jgi:thioredoxin reductase
MKKILVLGAGRSAITLIKYLSDNAKENNWIITVGDFSEELATKSIKNNDCAKSIFFDVNNEGQRKKEISVCYY